ncbi:hypothetical protein SAMN02745751_02421 [Dethiosulfatibacter aminovorans DSM 17477]|uniref:Uncharacterized protein n=1 Tax=Dethiosulfatibacter aminovorans DSM 17477 TaxID=1121476 RepID=A0A1M6ISS0_9FIRM|nr:hypothetical protein [Dethiosulfatibacter aminovorans]SHJ37496.1 hypothetical protein SAMN02745751_02421 [Dethiosulfatibacter aminovorans DSM 17477]
MKRFEDKIYNFLVTTDFMDSKSMRGSVSEFSYKLLFNKDYLKNRMHNPEGVTDLQELSERVGNRAYAYFVSKGYDGINANMFKLVVSRLVHTVGHQIANGDIDKEAFDELIRYDVGKMKNYIKKEPSLACFFEGY